MLDYHVILDLLPTVASLYFEKRLGNEVKLSAIQSSILIALGSQRKSVEDVEVSITPMYSQSWTLTRVDLSDRTSTTRLPDISAIR